MLCCQHSSQRCPGKVVPLPDEPIEQYRQKYKENLQRLGQPAPFLGVANKTECVPKCIACGTRASNGDVNLIINGQNAPAKHHPWQAYVRGASLSCGGVLIAPKWVLTAAHCIARTKFVMLGHTSIVNPSPHKVFRQAVREIVYKGNDVMKNDIAMIKMNAPVVYNEYIRPICLPPQDIDFTKSEECFVTGWGYTDFVSRIKSDLLQQVKVRVMSYRNCYNKWWFGNKVITSANVCTILNTTFPNAGVCMGDSGGPLACRHGDKYYLVGLTSLVQRNCHKTYLPDLFTRVAHFKNWVEAQMQEYGDE